MSILNPKATTKTTPETTDGTTERTPSRTWLNICAEIGGMHVTAGYGIALDDIIERTERECKDRSINNGLRARKLALARKLYELGQSTQGRQRVKLICEVVNLDTVEEFTDDVEFDFAIEHVD